MATVILTKLWPKVGLGILKDLVHDAFGTQNVPKNK